MIALASRFFPEPSVQELDLTIWLSLCSLDIFDTFVEEKSAFVYVIHAWIMVEEDAQAQISLIMIAEIVLVFELHAGKLAEMIEFYVERIAVSLGNLFIYHFGCFFQV